MHARTKVRNSNGVPFLWQSRAVDLSNFFFFSTCSLRKDDCSACGKTEELQHEILETSRKLTALLEKLETTKCAVNNAHSIILNRVPQEIISEIFGASHENIVPCEPQRALGFEAQNSSEKMLLSLRLAAICQLWRNIALSFPHIWTHVHIPLYRQINETNLAIAKEIMQRSKRLPLSISLFSNTNGITSWDETYPLKSTYHILEQESARWYSLRVCLPVSAVTNFFGAIGSLLNVRSLHVHSNEDRNIVDNRSWLSWRNKHFSVFSRKFWWSKKVSVFPFYIDSTL